MSKRSRQENGRRHGSLIKRYRACSEHYCVHDLICQTNLLVDDDRAIFYQLEGNKNDLQPSVKYNLVITSELLFYCYYRDIRLPFSRFNKIGIKRRKITLFAEIVQILDHLENINEEKPCEDVNYFVERLKLLECEDPSIKYKLQFLVEQLELAFMSIQHRRYSPELLSMCVLWENTFSALYKQLREEGVITLPSTRYIKKLTSALSMDTGLSEETVKYLKARVAKLNERERIGSLIMDEV